MDIFFQDPTEIPLPPGEVRIRELKAHPLPDGKRIRVFLEIDPFQKRPSAELTLSDPQGKQVASVSIVESMTRRIELTMHLPHPMPESLLTLTASLFYLAPLPEAGAQTDQSPFDRPAPEPNDQQQVTFLIPGF